jgi:hypothetical protein
LEYSLKIFILLNLISKKVAEIMPKNLQQN